ncbi:hypothetical protein SLS60_008263 [Paraconiothyrium brasiliense]|uniref:C2H2-type domain-containing protein n=1 Tax=Paraconiothyrium brasiliense TaxID=300254 RepID=A0ABR3R034_9PLEO
MVSAADVNRFALFADNDEDDSPGVDQSPKINPFVNQVADSDAPWEEVGRGGQALKVDKVNLKTLVIRDENSVPLARSHKKAREVSGSTHDSDSMKLTDPHEHWCGVCRFRFPNKNALVSHIKQSPQVHENYCNLCKRVFVDRNGLKNHVDHAVGHDTYCNLCLSAFKDAWGLKNHFENNYSVTGHDFVCLTCLLGFRSKTELDKHLFTGAKHVWCPTCHRKFRNQSERDEHWYLTTKHRHCLQPGCDFDALDQTALESHLRDDHFQCEGCKHIHVQIRSNRVDLEETVSWMKEGLLRPFICRAPGCGKTFSHFSSLVLHVESQACEWDIDRLRLDLIQAEFDRMCARRDSVTAKAD